MIFRQLPTLAFNLVFLWQMKKLMRSKRQRFTIIFLALLSLLCHGLTAQQLQTFSAEALKEDFKVFKNSIQDVHPGLYWYSDSAAIAQRFDKIESSIKEGMDIRDWYASLQEFYAQINCGHSWMSMPAAWVRPLDQGPYQLPIDIYFGEGKYTIQNDFTAEQKLAAGSQLVGINGQAFDKVFKSLWQYAPSDGFNQTRRKGIIAGNFSRYYQTFIQMDSVFSLSVQSPDGQVTEVQVSGIAKTVKDSLRKEIQGEPQGWWSRPLAEFEMMENATGYLRLHTFAKGWLKSQKINYDKFLKESFARLKSENAQSLILDLRGNGGGDDLLGAKLCRYLIATEFNYFDRMEAVTSKFKYKDYSSSKWLNLAGVLFKKDKAQPGKFTFNYHRGLKTQKPEKDAFKGQLIVLTDGGTFSTAADVASILHANDRGTFMGEEVGGGYYGNNSAVQYHIQLPNSKINYYIPVIRYYSSVDFPDFYGHGVKPDIAVSQSYEASMAGNDTVLEAAKAQLSKRQLIVHHKASENQ